MVRLALISLAFAMYMRSCECFTISLKKKCRTVNIREGYTAKETLEDAKSKDENSASKKCVSFVIHAGLNSLFDSSVDL